MLILLEKEQCLSDFIEPKLESGHSADNPPSRYGALHGRKRAWGNTAFTANRLFSYRPTRSVLHGMFVWR
jgi:hypothetical protein